MKSLRFSQILFLAGIAIIPLIYSNATLDPAFTLRALMLCALTLVTIFAVRKQPVRISPLLWLWCAYASFNIISIFVAQNSGEAIYGTSIMLLYGTWLFAATQMVTEEFRPRVLRAIAVMGFIIAFISLFQFFGLGFRSLPSRHIPSATMTTRNLMASFLFLTIPASLFLTLTESKPWEIFGLLTFTMSLLVLLISETRAVWLALAAAGTAAAIFFLLSHQRTKMWGRYRVKILTTAIAGSACLITVFAFNVPPRIEQGEEGAAEKVGTITNYASDTSAIQRLTLWKESLRMYKQYPLLGVGGGNWKIEIPKYGLADFARNIQDGSIQWTETHNDFLSALCETGIGGGLAFLGIFFVAIYLAIRSLGRAGEPRERLLVILTISGICGFAVISFFDFPNSRVEHSMLFLLWLAILDHRRFQDGHKAGRWAPYVAVLLVVPSLALSWQRFRAESHEKALLQDRIAENWNAVIEECNKIYDRRLLSVDALSTPILYYKAEAEFMQTNYDAALRDNLEALRDHPNHFYTMNNAGSCYVKEGNFRTGEVFYRRALAISPNFEESLLNLASVYFNQHQYDSAFECVRKCDTSQEGSRAKKIAKALWGTRR